MVKLKTCKLCKKKVQHLAMSNYPKVLYSICYDCFIDLDINHKNYKKYAITG